MAADNEHSLYPGLDELDTVFETQRAAAPSVEDTTPRDTTRRRVGSQLGRTARDGGAPREDSSVYGSIDQELDTVFEAQSSDASSSLEDIISEETKPEILVDPPTDPSDHEAVQRSIDFHIDELRQGVEEITNEIAKADTIVALKDLFDERVNIVEMQVNEIARIASTSIIEIHSSIMTDLLKRFDEARDELVKDAEALDIFRQVETRGNVDANRTILQKTRDPHVIEKIRRVLDSKVFAEAQRYSATQARRIITQEASSPEVKAIMNAALDAKVFADAQRYVATEARRIITQEASSPEVKAIMNAALDIKVFADARRYGAAEARRIIKLESTVAMMEFMLSTTDAKVFADAQRYSPTEARRIITQQASSSIERDAMLRVLQL
jgi:hypothetical protein